MQSIAVIFRKLFSVIIALLLIIVFLFVLGLDFLTFGLLSCLTWFICKLFKPFCTIQEKLFDFFNSRTTYNLWIFGWVTSLIGIWYMIVRFVHWLNDKLHNLFKRLYDIFEKIAKNIGNKGIDKLKFEDLSSQSE